MTKEQPMHATDPNRLVESYQGLSDDAFIMKAYLTLLGRAPDATGSAAYMARLRVGVPRPQIWSEIAEGDEARAFASRRAVPGRRAPTRQVTVQSVSDLLVLDGADFVRTAYRAILGRDADPSGLRDYTARLAAGTPKPQLLADLRSDPEGQAFSATLSGLDELVRQAHGYVTAAPDSVEDLVVLQGEQFVRAAYSVLFKREADPEGLGRYTELLRSGFSTMFVLKALLSAPEAQEKSAKLVGWSGALKSYDKAQARTLKGWFHREVMGSPSELPRERQSRALAYRVLERN
jgi:hypothetical protein